MRLTTIILIVGIMQVSAASFAQKVSLSRSNAPLKSVIQDLGSQSDFDFVYTDNLLRAARPVTIQVEGRDIREVLKQIFADQPLTYRIEDKTIVISRKEPSFLDEVREVFAIPIRVDGVVTDSLGVPLAGATVKVKGQKAVTSDDRGRFSFSAEVGTAVTVSFVGYEVYSFKLAEGQNTVSVVLKMVSGKLEEVVVNTGYERISKERATGSYDLIDNKQFNMQVGSNILDRLKNMPNSLQFGTIGSSIMIRGLSTINGTTDVLIVVDNFPYKGDLNNINPNDVESVSILKDAAATSIWGSRAGNGVIVITTKKGRFNQPVKIDFNANASVSGKPDLFALPQISSTDYINIQQMLFVKGVFNNAINNYRFMPALAPAVVAMAAQRDGKITMEQLNATLDSYRNTDARTDWDKYIYQNANAQRYSLSLTGGDNRINYYLSGGFDKNTNALAAQNSRVSLNSQVTFKVTDNLLVSGGLQYAKSSTPTLGKPAYGSLGIGATVPFYPYMKIADSKGNALPVAQQYRQSYVDTAGNGKLLDWNYYPLNDWKHTKNSGGSDDFLSNISINYKIIPGLNVNLFYQYDRQNNNTQVLNDIDSYYARTMINQYTQINPTTGIVTYPIPKGGIVNFAQSQGVTQNGRGQLSYNNSWGRHEVTAVAGAEINQNDGWQNGSTLYGYNTDPLSYTSVDVVNPIYPNFVTGLNQQIPGVSTYNSGPLNRSVSVYSNAAYIFDGKYTASLSARRDATNIFGVSINNKWKPLWSAGLSWNISKEDFFKLESISSLKLRTTYGVSGNVVNSYSGLTTIRYGESINSPVNYPYAQIGQLGNPDLKWEDVSVFNIGLDFGFFNNRITGSLDYFQKRDKDLYGPTVLDPTTGIYVIGATTITKNVATMKSNGVELNLNAAVFNGNFSWRTSYALNYNQGKVTSYYNQGQLNNANYVGGGLLPRIGQPLYQLISYRWAGLDPATGNPQAMLNGKASTDYSAIVADTNRNDLDFKSTIPKVFGSFNNTFQYGSISLDIGISYKLGYYFRKQSINYNSIFTGGIGHSDFARRWQQPGDEQHTYVPSMIYPANSNRDNVYNLSSVLAQSGNQIRLQFINLRYDVTSLLKSKKIFKQLEIYTNASNLGLLWRANKEHLDPDSYGTIPVPKTLTFGLKGGL